MLMPTLVLPCHSHMPKPCLHLWNWCSKLVGNSQRQPSLTQTRPSSAYLAAPSPQMSTRPHIEVLCPSGLSMRKSAAQISLPSLSAQVRGPSFSAQAVCASFSLPASSGQCLMRVSLKELSVPVSLCKRKLSAQLSLCKLSVPRRPQKFSVLAHRQTPTPAVGRAGMLTCSKSLQIFAPRPCRPHGRWRTSSKSPRSPQKLSFFEEKARSTGNRHLFPPPKQPKRPPMPQKNIAVLSLLEFYSNPKPNACFAQKKKSRPWSLFSETTSAPPPLSAWATSPPAAPPSAGLWAPEARLLRLHSPRAAGPWRPPRAGYAHSAGAGAWRRDTRCAEQKKDGGRPWRKRANGAEISWLLLAPLHKVFNCLFSRKNNPMASLPDGPNVVRSCPRGTPSWNRKGREMSWGYTWPRLLLIALGLTPASL